MMNRKTISLTGISDQRVFPPRLTSPRVESGVDDVDVEYCRTRTVEVDPNVLRENRIISGSHGDEYSNAYKIMKAPILRELKNNNWNSIGVTSAWNGEGKTLTAINLAISLAFEINHTVMLVDANLCNPSVTAYFGIEAKTGLSDCLLGEQSIEQVLIHPSFLDRIVILPGGGSLINAGEMLASHRMVDFIDEVKARYASRIIVFDLPSVLVAGEPLAIATYLDSIVLVAESGKTKSKDIARCEGLLSSANIVATVLAKTK